MKCAPSKAVFSFLKLQLGLGVLFAVIIIFFRSVPHLIIVIVVSAVVALRAQLYSTLVSLVLIKLLLLFFESKAEKGPSKITANFSQSASRVLQIQTDALWRPFWRFYSKRFSFVFIPFGSPWRALSSVFWVRKDTITISAWNYPVNLMTKLAKMMSNCNFKWKYLSLFGGDFHLFLWHSVAVELLCPRSFGSESARSGIQLQMPNKRPR